MVILIKTNSNRFRYFSFFNLQESEIVEVLWKQDVDLGYTLAPVKSNTPKESANVSGPSFSPEDNEKLKALQELKNEKVSYFSIILV